MSFATRLIAIITISSIVFVSSSNASWKLLEMNPELLDAQGQKSSQPLGEARSAAIGQLDADGVLDLCTAYATTSGGALVVTLGNSDFRQGLRRDLCRAEQGLAPVLPFAERGTVYPLPIAPDWLGIGDFDADGDQARDLLGRLRERQHQSVVNHR